MQRLAELCERIAATTKKTEKVALRGRLLPLARTAGRGHLGGVPLRTRLPRLRRAHAADRRLGAVEAGRRRSPARAMRRSRRPTASAATWARRPTMCCSPKAPTKLDHHAAGGPRRPSTRSPRPAPRRESCRTEVAAGARHRARSQVHPEDHHRRAAHRPEGKPGGRSDRQGLRRAARRRCSAPTCCWAISATRCCSPPSIVSTTRACGCFIPSASCWPARRPTPRRPSTTSSTRRSRTSTTAFARRRIAAAAQVRLFSRTLDEVTPSFPELVAAAERVSRRGHSRRRDRRLAPQRRRRTRDALRRNPEAAGPQAGQPEADQAKCRSLTWSST